MPAAVDHWPAGMQTCDLIQHVQLLRLSERRGNGTRFAPQNCLVLPGQRFRNSRHNFGRVAGVAPRSKESVLEPRAAGQAITRKEILLDPGERAIDRFGYSGRKRGRRNHAQRPRSARCRG